MGLGELCALLSALTVAVSGVINKYLTRRMAPVSLNATRTSGAALFLVALFFLSGKAEDIPSVNEQSLILIVGGGVITTLVGDTIYLRLLKTVDVAKAHTIAQALLTLLMVAIGGIVLDEDLTLITLTGSGFVIVGVYLLSQTTSSKNNAAKDLLGIKMLLGLLLVVCFWVTGLSFMREGLREVDAVTGNAARMVFISGLLMIFMVTKQFASVFGSQALTLPWSKKIGTQNARFHETNRFGQKDVIGTHFLEHGDVADSYAPILKPKWFRIDRVGFTLGIFSGSLSLGLGTTLMFIAFKETGVAITMVLFNSQLLILAPLSMLILKERLNLKAGIGILITVGGIIIVLL